MECQLMSSYISCQYNHWPLLCIIDQRKRNNKRNKIHERTLIIYGENKTSFFELLDSEKSVTIHQEKF